MAIRAAQRDEPREFKLLASATACTIKAEEGEGKLPTFTGMAYTGAPMNPEGWYGKIIVDLDGVKIASQHRPVLRQHDHEQIVGHTTDIKVSPAGIEPTGVLSGEKHHVEKVTVPAKNGFKWQMSIGANPTRTEFLEAGKEATVNGRPIVGPITISRETEIGEISFVPLGADGATSATVAASKPRKGNAMFHKTALKLAAKQGIKGATYSDEEIDKMSDDEAKTAFKKCMKAEDEPDEDKEKKKKEEEEEEKKNKEKAESAARDALKAELNKYRSEFAADLRRQSEVAAICQKYGVIEAEVDGKKVNVAAHAIEAGWTIDKTELTCLRAARPSHGVGVPGGLGYSTSNPIMNEAVLEAAVFEALGGQFKLFDNDFYAIDDEGTNRRVPEREQKRIQADLNARYPDQVRQAARTHFKGRMGLQQLLTTLASAKGYRGPATFNDPEGWSEVASFLSAPAIRADAGPSSVNTPATLANVQNKLMLQGLMFTEQAYMEVGQIISVKDLKPTKSVQLFGNFQFTGLNPGGEIQHATMGDNAWANQAKLYAQMITMELQYLINDDLAMFGQVPMMLGRGWGLKVNDLFWTAFMNPGKDEGGSTNFYAATHTITGQSENSNYSSGAGSVLNSAGLQAAILLFDNQVDPAGKPLGDDPELLVYPPDLDVPASELMNAQFIVMAGLASTAAASKQANTNIFKGRFKPIKSRYLNKSAYTGYSTTAWYLLANPAIRPVIQIAALNGQMAPMVQTASQDWNFNTLGISMRGWGGVGVNPQQSRGGVLSAGV